MNTRRYSIKFSRRVFSRVTPYALRIEDKTVRAIGKMEAFNKIHAMYNGTGQIIEILDVFAYDF